MSYNRMDHAGWVESNNQAANQIYGKHSKYKPRPEKLSEFQVKVMDILGMVGGGIYNAPINWEKVQWGEGRRWSVMIVPWRDGRMSTFDFYPLTRLVFLCHEARIRCEIRARAAGHFQLMFSQRSHEGGMADRHPNLDEAVAAFREYLPANHRVIYQQETRRHETRLPLPPLRPRVLRCRGRVCGYLDWILDMTNPADIARALSEADGSTAEYKCQHIDGIHPVFVPAMLKQYMACLYMQAVKNLSMEEAFDAAMATWGTDWEGDPEPRTYEAARNAVIDDLEHWESD